MSASIFVTYGGSMVTFFSFISGASKLMMSSTRSMMVCNRRAPMFSVFSFTRPRIARSLPMPPGEFQLQPSVSSSAVYCFTSDDFGSVRILHEILDRERLQLDTNREAALQLGNQIARLRNVERARGDEQNVVGPHHAVARVDGGSFHDRQNVALHAFAGNVGPVAAFAPGDLVDLIKEDDAALLHPVYRDALHLVHIDQALLLFLDQVLHRLADLHLPLLGLLAEDVGQHVLDVDAHLLHALVGDDLERRHSLFADVEFHDALVELAFAQLLAKFFAGAMLRIAFFRRGQLESRGRRVLGGDAGAAGSSRSSKRSSAFISALSAMSSSFSSRTMSMAISTRSRIIDSTSRPT